MLLQTGETENKARKSSQINPACAKILGYVKTEVETSVG